MLSNRNKNGGTNAAVVTIDGAAIRKLGETLRLFPLKNFATPCSARETTISNTP
jgi:hypothetical protein